MRAGGPVRSLRYLTDWLGDDYQFLVCTRDRDIGDRQSFANISVGRPIKCGKAKVIYLAPENLLNGMTEAWRNFHPDIVYLNSFFGPMTRYALWCRQISALDRVPILLAPRGEFNPGALALKQWKKQAYIWAAKLFGIGHRLHFHATNDVEAVEIRRLFGPLTKICTAVNLGPKEMSFPSGACEKKSGELKLVFLSRLVPKKNLQSLFPILATLRGRVDLSVWGPSEDSNYLSMLQNSAKKLPPNITISFRGEVAAANVWDRLAESQFFVLPTLGENHGHAIIEAWQAGLPVILSDRTPWRGLKEKKLGWDIPLDLPADWLAALQSCVDMDESTYQSYRQAVGKKVQQLNDNPPLNDWRRMFAGIDGGAE